MTSIHNHLRDINSLPRIGREPARFFKAAREICTPPMSPHYWPFTMPKHVDYDVDVDAPSRAVSS